MVTGCEGDGDQRGGEGLASLMQHVATFGHQAPQGLAFHRLECLPSGLTAAFCAGLPCILHGSAVSLEGISFSPLQCPLLTWGPQKKRFRHLKSRAHTWPESRPSGHLGSRQAPDVPPPGLGGLPPLPLSRCAHLRSRTFLFPSCELFYFVR